MKLETPETPIQFHPMPINKSIGTDQGLMYLSLLHEFNPTPTLVSPMLQTLIVAAYSNGNHVASPRHYLRLVFLNGQCTCRSFVAGMEDRVLH